MANGSPNDPPPPGVIRIDDGLYGPVGDSTDAPQGPYPALEDPQISFHGAFTRLMNQMLYTNVGYAKKSTQNLQSINDLMGR